MARASVTEGECQLCPRFVLSTMSGLHTDEQIAAVLKVSEGTVYN